MSCSISKTAIIDWTIQVKHIDELYRHLYDTKENGGEILVDHYYKTSTEAKTTHAGHSDSVDAPDSIFNWHSHPISCYKQEKTLWGWLSGEDVRESIIYGLRGSACHFVPSVEGLYTIQPNPCVVTNLLDIDKIVHKSDYKSINTRSWDWGDFLRGFIILSVEIYFRSTHSFRTIEYLEKHPNTTPLDYIKFANSFKLSNLFNKDNITGCEGNGIKCNQLQVFEKNKLQEMTFKNYTYQYESGKDTTIYLITKNGSNTVTNVKYIDILNSGGIDILKNLKFGKSCNISIPNLHTDNIFQVKLYQNTVKYKGQEKNYIEMPITDKINFINGSHVLGDVYMDRKTDIKVRMFDMTGKCSHNDLKTHIQSYGSNLPVVIEIKKTSKKKTSKKKTSRKYGSIKKKKRKTSIKKNKKSILMIIGSDDCPYCVSANTKAKKLKGRYNFRYVYNKHTTIKDAIETAKKLTGKDLMSIPVYILNGEVVSDPYARL